MIVRDGKMLKAKLCGMKTVEAARAAETAGADFINHYNTAIFVSTVNDCSYNFISH